jgi:ABC-2 type transport system permease protein
MSTTLSKPRAVSGPPGTTPSPASVDTRSAAAVWWQLYRHHLRVLRNGAIAWIVALAGISMGVAATFEDRYATQAELEAFAEFEGVPAFEAMLGRLVGLTTIEGGTLSRWGMFGVLAAIWGMLAAIRLLRGAEESGHLEPIRAGVVTPRGLLAAVLAALFTTHLAFAVAIGVSHSAAGMDPATSWALGAAAALLAACFAAAGALASQLVATNRRAVGIVGAALGLTLAVRVIAAASGSPEWLWWATPFGWITFLHEFDQARTAVFLAYSALVVVLVFGAFLLANRDLHAGWLGGTDDTPRRPVRPIRTNTGLAVRVTAPAFRTWAAVASFMALVFGLLARDFSEAVSELDTMVEMADALGWVGLDTPEGVVAWTFSLIVLVLAVFASGQAVAIREEEASWRIEHLLVRPLSRSRWLLTRTLVAAAAVALAAALAGLVAWLATAAVGTPIGVADGLLAAVNVLPVAWLALGIGVAVVGLAPRLTGPLTFGLVLGAYLLDFVGGMLELPEAVLDLSPFRHIAAVPAADMSAGPLVVMLVLTVALVAAGALRFRRRDLQQA